MKLFIAATLAALTIGAGAHASSGTDRLASSVGVEPGEYSLSQLVRLKFLKDSDSNRYRLQIKEIVENPEGPQASVSTASKNERDSNSRSWRNLALSLGVEPGRLSPLQLVALKSAIEDNDRSRINFLMSGEAESDTSEGSIGADRLARNLGLEPGLYTLGQLSRIKFLLEEDNAASSFRLRQILENPAF